MDRNFLDQNAPLIPASALRASTTKATPLQLFLDHPEGDRLTLPTGSFVYRQGEQVQAVYVVQLGLVELSTGLRNRIRYGQGELFFYRDLVETSEFHSCDAKALTPLSLIRLNRASFLTLIHKHPTLVLDLLGRQHARLREQRVDACHFY